jgi:hypothetical protein
MKMMVVRVESDLAYHALIEQAAEAFDAKVAEVISSYATNSNGFIMADYYEPITDEINITQ